VFRPKDGFEPFDMQASPRPIDQSLEDLFHLSTQMKDQITAALDLIDGVVVAKPAPLLAFQIQGETQTGTVDPALADLAQTPYSPGFGQGVCDLHQICGLRNNGETVSLLCKGDAGLPSLAGHVLMTIEENLGPERRMARHLDGQVAPVRVHDVKGIVTNEGAFGF
jgi:hypothetical protein